MSAINYATTLASLDAAIATAPSPDKELGQDIRERLADMGADLTARFTGAVDTAKTAWAAAAAAAMAEAEDAAGYIYSVKGQPAPPALVFQLYDPSAVTARIAAASALLEPSDAFLARALAAHRAAWSAAWGSGGGESAFKYFALARNAADPNAAGQACATLERSIYELINGEAAQWLALAAF